MISKSDKKRHHRDFEDTGTCAACRELWEEAGLGIKPETVAALPQYIGAKGVNNKPKHWNFAVVLDRRLDLEGPHWRGRKEVCYQGCADLLGAIPAGGGYHVWADIEVLLKLTDLLPFCGAPFMHLRDVEKNAFWRCATS